MRRMNVENKALKLVNACIYNLSDNEIQDVDQVVYHMESYIKAKGASPRGPLIQCTNVKQKENGETDISVQIIMQTDKIINKLEYPYMMKEIVRCPDCLYVRYIGDEEKVHMAYDKLNLYSYEENIELTGTTYTIFIGNNGDFVADIFMEKRCI